MQAEDQEHPRRHPDDEETEDEDVFKEQQLLKQAQAKRDAKVDRLARLKIDRYKLVGEDKLLVKQVYLQICQEQTAHSGVASCASIYDSNHP